MASLLVQNCNILGEKVSEKRKRKEKEKKRKKEKEKKTAGNVDGIDVVKEEVSG